MTIRFAFALAATGVAGLSVPAFADPEPGQNATAPTAGATAAIDPKTDQRRVCVISETTGSRVPNKTCKSRADWIAHGVDPLAKQ